MNVTSLCRDRSQQRKRCLVLVGVLHHHIQLIPVVEGILFGGRVTPSTNAFRCILLNGDTPASLTRARLGPSRDNHVTNVSLQTHLLRTLWGTVMYFTPTHLLAAHQHFDRPLSGSWSTFVTFQVPSSLRLSASASLPMRWNLCLSTLGLGRRDNMLLTALMDSEVRSSH